MSDQQADGSAENPPDGNRNNAQSPRDHDNQRDHDAAGNGEKGASDRDPTGPDPAGEEEQEPDTTPRGAEARFRDSRTARRVKGRVRVTGGDVTLGTHYGDKYTIINNVASRPGDGRSSVALPIDRVRRLHAVHVAVASEDELAARLAADRVAFLAGTEDTGRCTSAVVALAAIAKPTRDRPLRLIRAAASFTALADQIDGEASGYLLDATRASWLPESADTDLDHLRSALSRHNAYLTVLVDTEDDVSRMRERPVPHVRPNLDEVFVRHLASGLLPSGDAEPSRAQVDAAVTGAARDLLDRVAGVPAVRSWRAGLDSPGDAVVLAGLLSDETGRGARLPDPDTLDQAVDAARYKFLVDRARDLLRSRADEHSPVDQAFVIASAVLDEAPLATVITAAESLAARLREVEQSGRWLRSFVRPLGHRLRHADLRQRQADGVVGPDTVVALNQPPLWGPIVDVVWQEYSETRGPLREWLVDLCERPSGDVDEDAVRIGIDLALTRLATHDFDLIVSEVLEPWARLSSAATPGSGLGSPGQPGQQGERRSLQRCRWVAAHVLENLVVDTPRRAQAFDLLDRWIYGFDRDARNTAVLAFGSRIARVDPKRVFDGFAFVVDRLGTPGFGRRDRDGGAELASGHLVELALEAAYDVGMRRRTLKFLFADWWHGRPRQTLTMVRALLRICSLRENPNPDGDSVRGPCPDLLVWLDAPYEDPVLDPDHLTGEVARLWSIALRHEHLTRAAWSLLHRWDDAVESAGTPGQRGRLDRLKRHLHAEPDLRGRIAHYERVRRHLASVRRDGTAGPPTGTERTR